MRQRLGPCRHFLTLLLPGRQVYHRWSLDLNLALCLPAPIRLTQLGVASTPVALVEAATAFGATPSQKLWKVELPWALQ
ncbi:MAG TPA: hypothetical protein PLX97_12530, partial [Gemmatales bacterium]|nr:hypothetical protein [Gemmatales bacterium]